METNLPEDLPDTAKALRRDPRVALLLRGSGSRIKQLEEQLTAAEREPALLRRELEATRMERDAARAQLEAAQRELEAARVANADLRQLLLAMRR